MHAIVDSDISEETNGVMSTRNLQATETFGNNHDVSETIYTNPFFWCGAMSKTWQLSSRTVCGKCLDEGVDYIGPKPNNTDFSSGKRQNLFCSEHRKWRWRRDWRDRWWKRRWLQKWNTGGKSGWRCRWLWRRIRQGRQRIKTGSCSISTSKSSTSRSRAVEAFGCSIPAAQTADIDRTVADSDKPDCKQDVPVSRYEEFHVQDVHSLQTRRRNHITVQRHQCLVSHEWRQPRGRHVGDANDTLTDSGEFFLHFGFPVDRDKESDSCTCRHCHCYSLFAWISGHHCRKPGCSFVEDFSCGSWALDGSHQRRCLRHQRGTLNFAGNSQESQHSADKEECADARCCWAWGEWYTGHFKLVLWQNIWRRSFLASVMAP